MLRIRDSLDRDLRLVVGKFCAPIRLRQLRHHCHVFMGKSLGFLAALGLIKLLKQKRLSQGSAGFWG